MSDFSELSECLTAIFPDLSDHQKCAKVLMMQTTRPDIAVSTFGSRVAVVFNMQRGGGPPRMSQSTVYVFEMHRWAWARDGIETCAPGTVFHTFDFSVLPHWGIVRPRDPLPYGIYKQEVVYEDDQHRSHRKFVLLLEDAVALVVRLLLDLLFTWVAHSRYIASARMC